MLDHVLNLAAGSIDRALTLAIAPRRSRHEGLGHGERLRALAHVAGIYDRAEHYPIPTSFFPAPPRAEARLRPVHRDGDGQILDATWPSGFLPHAAEVEARYLDHEPNRTAAARLFVRSGRPRPAIVLIHGYRAGGYAFEERSFPVRWLLSRGLDVALFVLPFHAVRGLPGPPRFPSADPRITVEGFRQAVHDFRALVALLRDRGAPEVGVMGMSLGGYTTALLSTVVDDLAFAIPMIPLASIGDFSRDHGRLVGSPEEQDLQHEAIERAHKVVSPLARPPRLARDRLLILAASGDRITPIHHARRLARHFDVPVEAFDGGHLLQFGRGQAFRAAGRMLRRLGLFDR